MDRVTQAFADRVLPLFDGFVRLGGPVFVALGLGLVSMVAWLFFTVPLVPLPWAHPVRPLLSLLGAFLYVNVVFNWLACVFTNPGRPPIMSPPSPLEKACQRCGDNWKPPRRD